MLINYLGQGAWVLNHADTALAVNPFFAIMPTGMRFFITITLAGHLSRVTSGVHSETEAMNLHFWPRMRIKHPTHVKGSSISR